MSNSHYNYYRNYTNQRSNTTNNYSIQQIKPFRCEYCPEENSFANSSRKVYVQNEPIYRDFSYQDMKNISIRCEFCHEFEKPASQPYKVINTIKTIVFLSFLCFS
ncbi:hypothetical protein I4U23_015999 [Adineta vaga]|nr:hypothetical protein I4U23_015999 [Adineta vaga]